MQEMNPYFVVTTLVGRFDSKNFMINSERTVHANMPLSLVKGWLDETAHISTILLKLHQVPTMLQGCPELASSCWQTPPQWCRTAGLYLIVVAMQHH